MAPPESSRDKGGLNISNRQDPNTWSEGKDAPPKLEALNPERRISYDCHLANLSAELLTHFTWTQHGGVKTVHLLETLLDTIDLSIFFEAHTMALRQQMNHMIDPPCLAHGEHGERVDQGVDLPEDHDRMHEMLNDLENHKLPKNLYFAKKILADLGMKYEKIDVCPNNCIMFWEEDGLTISKSLMKKFENEIPILVCKLEIVFLPGFMNVMQHLLVHLAWEALIAGPMQYRLMYPIERGLKKLKATVRNKARVEGCTAESFALNEISHFSSKYFAQRNNVFAPTLRVQMEYEAPQGNLQIFKHQGKPVGSSTVFANNVHEDLKQLAHTYMTAKNYSRYDVNGYRFRTTKLEKSRPFAATVNSGVMTSAYDANDKLVNYYGGLQNIVELVFSGPKELKVVFFECDWFNPRNGTRVDKYGMVEVKHSSRLPSRINSVVLANRAEQVYYLPYPHPSLKTWWVAFKVNPQVCPPENVDYMSIGPRGGRVKVQVKTPRAVAFFQGTTQSRHRQEQLLGCLQAHAQAQEVPMAAQEEAEEQAPQEQAEEEAPQEEAEEEAPQEEAAQEDPMGEGDVAGGSSSVRRFRFRSCNSVPKRPVERMLIRPRGEWQWEDVTWDDIGRHSKVNSMLGALCRYYYPSMVEVDGERQAAEQWSHWRLKEYVQPDEGNSAGGSSAGGSSEGGSSQAQRRTCQSVVWDEFWLRYHLDNEDDMEVLRSVRRHFCRVAEKVIDDAFYNARISAVCQYYKRIKGENMSKEKGAS
ncbi:hypothetical protein U9M48_013985 [Paspalum notatum var. saurae]|uniref:Transposase n=1 Tax=Paspalum notatum var. saurae TaxID=547442 RepID=A0AAQ3T1X8_PASNO